MISQWWSWSINSLALVSTCLIARESVVGWFVAFTVNVLWFIYGIATRQWGFVATSPVYATICLVAVVRRYQRRRQSPRVDRRDSCTCVSDEAQLR